MRRGLLPVAICLGWMTLVSASFAGGSGLNVIVVVNEQSSNSVALGNYYCEMRQVPPQNLVRMSNWAGGNVSWTLQQFTNTLLTPLHSAIKSRRLTNQADFVLLSMGIPYRVEQGVHSNSTTSALFYGFKNNDAPPGPNFPNSCSLPDASINSYSGSEAAFRAVPPGSLSFTNLLATMVTASNLALAKVAVSQGALSDATFPGSPVYLVKSPADPARNIRYQLADSAVFDARLQGFRPLIQTNANNGLPPAPAMSGAQTGWMNYNPFVTTFAPGSLVDNLTSLGGMIFEYNVHLRLIEILRAGASGTYGTIDEPCGYLEKFPTPHVFFYQARGFSLAESYYMSVANPYQGLTMGDPLAAPYLDVPWGYWTNLPASPVSGSVNLGLQAFASNPRQRVGRIDLYVDDLWFQTLTNIPPTRYNTVTVTIGTASTTYTVPLNATASSVAAGLATALNGNKAQTKTAAVARGDRIELRYENRSVSGPSVPAIVQASQGIGQSLATHAFAAQGTFLDTVAYGVREYAVSGNPTNRWLSFTMTKTNGAQVTVGATNTSNLTLYELCQSFVNAINSEPSLLGANGVAADDVVNYGSKIYFNLRVRSPGWNAAQFLANAAAATGLTFTNAAQVAIDQNLYDLQPRNHLYVTSGFSSVPLAFSLNTTLLPNGPHQLTAVIADGSNVRAQRRVSTTILVQNGTLAGSLETLVGGTNTALEGTMQFRVSGSGATISKVELYSTGGLVASSNQGSAVFNVPGTYLGAGLHPVYGLITSSTGQQYRTQTKWVRIVDYEPAFRLTASAAPDVISWPATAGRTYTILSTTNLTRPLQAVASVTPTNDTALWPATNSASVTRYYQVRTGN